ncbi:hypothetical protein ACET3Z_001936 [Daucus carota]
MASPLSGSDPVAGSNKSPGWLPAGWTVTYKTRTSGATAGTVDKYYVEPITGARFRSKVEVERYLETGSKNKLPSDANATPLGTLNKNNEKSGTKKTGTKRKKEAVWSFDFKNPPEEVTWSLVDGMWKPSIGGEQVQESTAQEWAATFELECKME